MSQQSAPTNCWIPRWQPRSTQRTVPRHECHRYYVCLCQAVGFLPPGLASAFSVAPSLMINDVVFVLGCFTLSLGLIILACISGCCRFCLLCCASSCCFIRRRLLVSVFVSRAGGGCWCLLFSDYFLTGSGCRSRMCSQLFEAGYEPHELDSKSCVVRRFPA